MSTPRPSVAVITTTDHGIFALFFALKDGRLIATVAKVDLAQVFVEITESPAFAFIHITLPLAAGPRAIETSTVNKDGVYSPLAPAWA